MKKISKVWYIVAVVLVVAVSVWAFSGSKRKEQVDFVTEKVAPANIQSSITATGTIEPVTSVTVGTQVSGIVSKLYVDYNSVVKKGQVIAELDKSNLMSQLNSAKANLQQMQANLRKAQEDLAYQHANFNRYKTLYNKGLVSANDFETARLSYQTASQSVSSVRQQVNAAQEEVKRALTNLGYATITSPIDGIVLSKSVEEGQTVAASFSTPELFTIAQDLTNMQVVANVDEADIGGVKEGERVTFTVDAYPDETFQGTVKQVRQEATTTNNVVTYEVVISAPNANLKLKPGLTANVTIFTAERSGVLSVSSKALRYTPTKETVGHMKIVDGGGKSKVWVIEGNTIKSVNDMVDEKKVIIELQNVKRDFMVGDELVHALRGVSFKIMEGEFVTIMGKSGSGKSTLLNQLGCLDTPSSGEYYLDGVSVRNMSRSQRAVLRNRKIGFIFQNYNLLPKTTSVENVELPLMYNASVSAEERTARAIEALKAVGLGERLYHKSNQMSGGQMQRVAIARALVNNPAVILADEATGNLDTRTSFEILVLFQKLHAEGRTIIFVTHNPDIARYSSRNIQLRDGRVISDEYNNNIQSAAEGLAAMSVNSDE